MESRYSSVIGVIELKINPQTAPRSWFFSHHPVRTAALSFILSVWTFLMFLHSVLTFCRGNTNAPVEQVEQSQILYRKKHVMSHNIKNVFFREALIMVQEYFTKSINVWINLPILISLKQTKKRVYRTSIQITNLDRKLVVVDSSMAWIKLYTVKTGQRMAPPGGRTNDLFLKCLTLLFWREQLKEVSFKFVKSSRVLWGCPFWLEAWNWKQSYYCYYYYCSNLALNRHL